MPLAAGHNPLERVPGEVPADHERWSGMSDLPSAPGAVR
jgi:hypothetical protein